MQTRKKAPQPKAPISKKNSRTLRFSLARQPGLFDEFLAQLVPGIDRELAKIYMDKLMEKPGACQQGANYVLRTADLWNTATYTYIPRLHQTQIILLKDYFKTNGIESLISDHGLCLYNCNKQDIDSLLNPPVVINNSHENTMAMLKRLLNCYSEKWKLEPAVAEPTNYVHFYCIGSLNDKLSLPEAQSLANSLIRLNVNCEIIFNGYAHVFSFHGFGSKEEVINKLNLVMKNEDLEQSSKAAALKL